MTIRPCAPEDFEAVLTVINDAAAAYRGVIPPDCWKDPYMPADELRGEIEDGVVFWGAFEGGELRAVMGLQPVADVALIRHAYTQSGHQHTGLGAALLAHLRSCADHPLLVGTWKAATWAVGFYERHGFTLVEAPQKDALLRRYWTVPERQIAGSVVLADRRWREGPASGAHA